MSLIRKVNQLHALIQKIECEPCPEPKVVLFVSKTGHGTCFLLKGIFFNFFVCKTCRTSRALMEDTKLRKSGPKELYSYIHHASQC